MSISIEQKVLLHLLKESLTGSAERLPEQWLQEADWEDVFREARSQAVILQAYDAVGTYKQWVPETVYQQWFQLATKILRRNMQVQLAQNALVQLLEENGLAYAILKGTSSASYYPRPELRSLGDIDFLIDMKQEQQVRRCLEQAGYETEGKDTDHHALYIRGKVPHEMHFQPAGVPDGAAGVRFSQYLEDLLQTVVPTACDMASFAAPDQAHHGVIILLHTLHHVLGGGIGLRHLCDWAVVVQVTAEADFWQGELVPLMEECGVLRFASVITRICADVLGTVCPAWCEVVEADLLEAVLQDILNGGNFGRKELDRGRESTIVSMKSTEDDTTPVGKALSVLHRSTPRMYPIVKKYRFLHPILDLYRGIRYLFQCLVGKRRWITVMLPKARQRQSVYERLRIFQP